MSKRKIFDRDAIHPGLLFGAATAWLIMFGLQVYKYGATTFSMTLWLLPSMIFFGMATLLTIFILRQKEEEKWEKG